MDNAVGLGEVWNREIASVRLTNNYILNTPLLEVGPCIRRIKYHEPNGEGDRHFIDAHFDDGTMVRFFNIEAIDFKKEVAK